MTELIKRRRWTIDEWRSVSARQSASGLSAVAFCRRESINLSSFYRARERWGYVDERSVPGSLTSAAAPLSTQSAFVDLGSLRSSASSLSLRLDLGEGWVLSLERR